MPKTLYVHVGAGKTGTSALQSFFLLNKKALRDVGVGFPVQGQTKINGGLSHHYLSDHGAARNSNALQDWRDLGSEDIETSIVSSENLHNKISAPDGAAFFTTIRDTLDCDIRIVFYIRRQSQWLQSAYAQFVKSDIETRSFPEFVTRYTRNLPDQVLRFAEIFGPKAIILRPFEKAQFHGGEICHDFCHALGIDWNPAFRLPEGNANPRLAPDALELKRRLNMLVDNPQTLKPLLQALLDYSNQTDSTGSAGTFHTHTMLDPAEQLRIERENAPKYRIIAETLLGRSDGQLFYDGLEAKLSATLQETKDRGPIDTGNVAAVLLLENSRRIERLKAKVAGLTS